MISSISAGILAFLLTLIGIPAFIRFYRKAQITGQQMHEDVKQHQAKAGTPTMGGLVFLIVAVVVSFLVAIFTQQLTNNVGMILFILVLYGLVGFLDDFLKVFRKINEGLNPKQKLALQLLGGVIFYLFYERGGDMLSVFGYQVHLGIFYIFFALFWLVRLPVSGEVQGVYYLTPTKELQSLDFTVREGMTEFITSHFSTYTVVYQAAGTTSSAEEKPSASDAETLANEAEQLSAGPSLAKAGNHSPKEQLPATGEASNPLLFLAGLSLALTATFMLKGRKDESN